MIVSSLADSSRYEQLNPLFSCAFDYIKSLDAAAEPGRLDLAGGDVVVMVNETAMKAPDKARMEVHDRFVDIHVPLSCAERFFWKDRATLLNPCEPFNREKDALHYSDVADTRFEVQPGQFAVFFPEDAHAGCVGEGVIRKIVVKVRVG